MSRPTTVILNCETGVTEERELNDIEYQEFLDMKAKSEQEASERQAAEAAAAELKASALAKLAALGLTEDEAKAIAG